MIDNTVDFFPKRLTEAREAVAMSMSALAEECDLSPAAISAFESARRKPSSETVRILAQKLDVPFRYLVKERPFPVVAEGAVFFRSTTTARTRREQKRRSRLARWSYEVSAWIDKYVDLPVSNLPEPESLGLPESGEYDEEDIEQAAYSLREYWKLTMGPIPQLIDLLEANGVFVVRQDLKNRKLDAFSQIINGRPMVFLGNSTSAVRSRFDAAHELAHLILHQQLSQEDISEPTILKRIEQEANLFAAAFLLPEQTLAQELYGLTLGSFQILKKRWLVSMQAIIYRCQQIGALDADQSRSLFIQISSKGWRTKEPLDDVIEHENSALPRQAWELIASHPGIDASAILDELSIPSYFVANVLGVEEHQIIPASQEADIVRLTPELRKSL